MKAKRKVKRRRRRHIKRFKTVFGPLVRYHRRRRGMSLSKLAKPLGINKGYVSAMEIGLVRPPSAKHMKKIAHLLQLNPTFLVTLGYLEKAPEIVKRRYRRILKPKTYKELFVEPLKLKVPKRFF